MVVCEHPIGVKSKWARALRVSGLEEGGGEETAEIGIGDSELVIIVAEIWRCL